MIITFYKRKNNKVVTYRSKSSLRIFAKIRACKKAEMYKIKVVYGKDLDSESFWYSSKKDTLDALRAFLEVNHKLNI